MRKYVEYIDRFKYFIIIGITLVVALLSLSLKDLAFEGSYKIWFDKDSKIIKDYEAFRSRFSRDDTFIVAFKEDNGIFTQKAVQTILRLTDAFKKIEGVRKVESLSNYQYTSSEGDDIIVEDFLYGDENLTQKRNLHFKTTSFSISLSPKTVKRR